MQRRDFMRLAGTAAVAGMAPRVMASSSSQQPIRLICPFPPGGVIDVLARALGTHMGSALGQTIVVENKAGAGGMIGSAEVARAAPTGTTLLFNSSSLVQAPLIFQNSLYDPLKDFTPIGSLGSTVMPFVVRADSPVHSLEAFVEYARGKHLAYGTYGPGTTSHAFQQLLSNHDNLDMTHIPYKGEAPMLADLLGGQIACAMGTLNTLMPQIQAGNLRALVLLSPQPLEALPNVPTFAELGYPPEFTWRGGFIGLFGPAHLPIDIARRLANAFGQAVANPAMQRTMRQAYVTGKPSELEATAREVTATYEAWAALVKNLNLAAAS